MMTSSVSNNNNGCPPSGWYPPPYSSSYYPQQQASYPHGNQHPGQGSYGESQPPSYQQAPPPMHQTQQHHAHPPMHQPHAQYSAVGQQPPPPPYYPYQNHGTSYPSHPPISRNNSNGSGVYAPPSSYGESQYSGMGPNAVNNPSTSYQPQHHQSHYPYQQPPQQYGGYHPQQYPHHSDESVDRNMTSDNRPTPTSDGDPHDSFAPPHSTPRTEGQYHGQYSHYGGASSADPSTKEPGAGMYPPPHYGHGSQINSHQQQNIHTPSYPTSQSGPQTAQSSMSAWMNYPVGTPGQPTPPTTNGHHMHTYPSSGGPSNTPSLVNPASNYPGYYNGSQQNLTNNSNIPSSGSFPAPPPFPAQQKRCYPPPISHNLPGIPPRPFDPPTSNAPFDPPISESMSKRSSRTGQYEPKERALEGAKRRFSFGTHVSKKATDSSVHSPKAKKDAFVESPSDSIPAPPSSTTFSKSAPPKSKVSATERQPKIDGDERCKRTSTIPLQESNRQNNLHQNLGNKSKLDSPSAQKNDSETATDENLQTAKKTKSEEQKEPTTKTPSFDDASLLLGLRTHSNTNSPETVPATVSQDSHDDTENNFQKIKRLNAMNSEDCDNKSPDDMKAKLSIDTTRSPTNDDSFPALVPAPNTNSMVPVDYPRRLALPNDAVKLNSLHCFIRQDLLEIFVIEPTSLKKTKHLYAPSSSVGRVGLRCVHCAMVRRKYQDECTKSDKEADDGNTDKCKDEDQTEISDGAHIARDDEAPMAVFYPKSIAEIYRLVTSWQRCHLRKCRNVPPKVRGTWNELRDTDKSRGKTTYWISSAKELGLIDCTSRAGGIRFRIRQEVVSKDDDTKIQENVGISKVVKSEDSAKGTYGNTQPQDDVVEAMSCADV